MGKGSSPRPYSVDQKTFDDNWDKIFNKKPQEPAKEKTKKEKSNDTKKK
jgi:hypothetical protein